MASNGLACSIPNNVIVVGLNLCKKSAWYHLEELSKLTVPRSNNDEDDKQADGCDAFILYNSKCKVVVEHINL